MMGRIWTEGHSLSGPDGRIQGLISSGQIGFGGCNAWVMPDVVNGLRYGMDMEMGNAIIAQATGKTNPEPQDCSVRGCLCEVAVRSTRLQLFPKPEFPLGISSNSHCCLHDLLFRIPVHCGQLILLFICPQYLQDVAGTVRRLLQRLGGNKGETCYREHFEHPTACLIGAQPQAFLHSSNLGAPEKEIQEMIFFYFFTQFFLCFYLF